MGSLLSNPYDTANGNTGAANSLAFQLAKITQNVGQIPGGGRFGRDPDGRLNGVIYEPPALMKFIDVALPGVSPATIAKAIPTYARQMAALGITTLHEPGTIKAQWVPGLAKLSNMVAVRMSASLSYAEVAASKAFASLGPGTKAKKTANSRFSLYGIKFWADGSTQQEGALQTIPYLNTKSKGESNFSAAEMSKLCRSAKEAGWSILIHCHGDAGIDDALDAIESVYGAHPPTGINVLQHATLSRQDQLERMKRLGVEATFLPNFIHFYGAAYRDQILGLRRTEFMEPMAACVKLGLPFSLHSDCPATPAGPLQSLQTAVTRRCIIDNSTIGADQTVSVGDALKAITIHAARHIGLEDTIGSLEVGKEADLTILENNPYTTEPEKLGAMKVSETWVAGEKTYG
jgi:predicted amidohydrolase YtcJ